MCRTVHAVLSTAICGIQMLVRVFMTIILMLENLIRMILQTLYNFISFMLQMISLIPICVVFLVTARLKCFMCGGGGPCPVNRGGACDCLMSAVALIILFFIFRATGVLDKIFYKIGYIQSPPLDLVRFVPTPGEVTECSRNDLVITTILSSKNLRYMDYTTETETESEEIEETTKLSSLLRTEPAVNTITPLMERMKVDSSIERNSVVSTNHFLGIDDSKLLPSPIPGTERPKQVASTQKMKFTVPPSDDTGANSAVDLYTLPNNFTTVLYFLV